MRWWQSHRPSGPVQLCTVIVLPSAHTYLVGSLIRFAVISLLVSLSGSLSCAALLQAQQSPDEGQFTIAVDVDLVVFNVTVTDGKDRHVSGLRPSDFHILEENRLQNITLFNAEDVPASIGLIIDNSSSMRDKRADVAKAALAFAECEQS